MAGSSETQIDSETARHCATLTPYREGRKTGLVKVAFIGDAGAMGETVESVYGRARIKKIAKLADLYPIQITSENIGDHLSELQNVQAIFSTWGIFPLTESQLDCMPLLEAMFFAGGTVKHFAGPLLRRGILVTSAAAANAVPVAEFTLGQILLANKGYFRNLREYRRTGDYLQSFVGAGNYELTVSLLGAGQIGTLVIELLRPFKLQVLVFDPHCSVQRAKSLGVEKVDLREAFERGDIVSNHLADVPETRELLGAGLFSAMPENATFINTGRGRTVNHAQLGPALRSRPDLTALLDVTDPQPLLLDDALWQLPNVCITSHIAGSKNREVGRIADLAIEEFELWLRGEPPRYPVSLESLERST